MYIFQKYKRRKDLQNQPQTVTQMAIGTYISIITLNVNGLNAPTKRHRLAEWIQNKTHIYAVYKKLTSDLKTHTNQINKDLIHSSILAWRIPGMGEPGGLPSMGSQSRTQLK